jgi:hypothetical protein
MTAALTMIVTLPSRCDPIISQLAEIGNKRGHVWGVSVPSLMKSWLLTFKDNSANIDMFEVRTLH